MHSRAADRSSLATRRGLAFVTGFERLHLLVELCGMRFEGFNGRIVSFVVYGLDLRDLLGSGVGSSGRESLRQFFLEAIEISGHALIVLLDCLHPSQHLLLSRREAVGRAGRCSGIHAFRVGCTPEHARKGGG